MPKPIQYSHKALEMHATFYAGESCNTHSLKILFLASYKSKKQEVLYADWGTHRLTDCGSYTVHWLAGCV